MIKTACSNSGYESARQLVKDPDVLTGAQATSFAPSADRNLTSISSLPAFSSSARNSPKMVIVGGSYPLVTGNTALILGAGTNVNPKFTAVIDDTSSTVNGSSVLELRGSFSQQLTLYGDSFVSELSDTLHFWPVDNVAQKLVTFSVAVSGKIAILK
jgi:hypothetical protein